MLLYFIMGLALIIFWVLFRRVIMLGVFLVLAGGFYFFVMNNQSNSMGGALGFLNSNKLGEVKDLVNQEAQTVLSFYSTLSNKQGSLEDQFTQLSNKRERITRNDQVIQSISQDLGINRIKNTVDKIKNLNPKSEALLYAVSKGQVKISEMLIKEQADINAQDQYGRTPLIIAATGCDAKMVKMLLDNR